MLVPFVALACCAAFALQFSSIALVLWRIVAGRWPTAPASLPAVSLLRPVCGIENNIEETLASAFSLSHPDYELILCVAAADDPVIPLAERLIAAHPQTPARLLVGDDPVSGNPKLNNLVKGWAAARHDWIAMADSNVLLPPDYLQVLLARWTPGTGLVSSPPGRRPSVRLLGRARERLSRHLPGALAARRRPDRRRVRPRQESLLPSRHHRG